ncbi:MAG: hypothetical protein WCX70_02695 [Candidatus Paceibacterota bacterium]|jgi:hypothetical protein
MDDLYNDDAFGGVALSDDDTELDTEDEVEDLDDEIETDDDFDGDYEEE